MVPEVAVGEAEGGEVLGDRVGELAFGDELGLVGLGFGVVGDSDADGAAAGVAAGDGAAP